MNEAGKRDVSMTSHEPQIGREVWRGFGLAMLLHLLQGLLWMLFNPLFLEIEGQEIEGHNTYFCFHRLLLDHIRRPVSDSSFSRNMYCVPLFQIGIVSLYFVIGALRSRPVRSL